MKQPDVRYAMASREWGLRRVRRWTWGIAGAGAVGAAVLAFGFGSQAHHAQGTQSPATGGAQSPARMAPRPAAIATVVGRGVPPSRRRARRRGCPAAAHTRMMSVAVGSPGGS